MAKSQAALEFLTTYGWAFLIILVMIGALAYFGILNPSKILPNRCNFGVEFQCLDYQISATGGAFKLKLKNNVGEPINVDAGKITLSTESATPYSCSASPAYAGWKSGEIKDIPFTCSGGGLAAGEKGKVLITVRFYTVTSGFNYEKEVKGEVFSTVI